MAHAGGRPRKYPVSGYVETVISDAVTLQSKVNAYFADCVEKAQRANKHGLAVYLDVMSQTVDEWRVNKDGRYDEFAPIIKKAHDRITNLFQQRTDAMAIISLKQPCYGGFIDKPVDSNKEININVKLSAEDADLAD